MVLGVVFALSLGGDKGCLFLGAGRLRLWGRLETPGLEELRPDCALGSPDFSWSAFLSGCPGEGVESC